MNDFQGFLCTNFQSLGISRKLEFLSIKNRQFVVDNKPNFKKYSLTIEILSKYSEYEAKYRQLISFLDRNKKDGFRLYFKPYENMEERYCLCDIETSVRADKRQPVVLTVTQGSLWFGNEKIERTAQEVKEKEGLFGFLESDDGYYSASFAFDDKTNDYNIEFYSNVSTEAKIINNGYNEIPLNIKIYGHCVNPVVFLFRVGEENPIKKVQVIADIDDEYYLEIKSSIRENGVWYVKKNTGEKIDYSELVNNEMGSPYFYIDNGEYIVRVVDVGNNVCTADISYAEEYSE
jgi:hypothetical protein